MILLLVTTLTGATLILFDGEILLVLGTTFIVGFTMLILLGLLDLSRFDPVEEARKFEVNLPSGPLFKRITEKKTENGEKSSGTSAPAAPDRARPLKQKVEGAWIKLKEYVASIRSYRSSRKADARKPETIDALLDRTISEPVSGDTLPGFDDLGIDFEDDESGDVEKRISAKIESLASLSDETFEKLESEINEKVFAEEPEDGLELDFDVDEVPALANGGVGGGSSAEDGRAAFGFDPVDDLEGLEDLSGEIGGFDFEEDDLSSLDNLDLGGLEHEELGGDLDAVSVEDPGLPEIDEPAAPSAPKDPGTGAGSGVIAAPKPVPVPEPEEEDDFSSFGFGGGGESDLMSLLKSDSRRSKSVTDMSLVRSLKGIDVDARDLEREMQEVLGVLNRCTGKRKE